MRFIHVRGIADRVRHVEVTITNGVSIARDTSDCRASALVVVASGLLGTTVILIISLLSLVLTIHCFGSDPIIRH